MEQENCQAKQMFKCSYKILAIELDEEMRTARALVGDAACAIGDPLSFGASREFRR